MVHEQVRQRLLEINDMFCYVQRQIYRRGRLFAKDVSRQCEKKGDVIHMNSIEDKIQIACVKWFDFAYPKLKLLLHHSPNGGLRNISEATRFKQMGVRAGFPDLILLYDNGIYNYLAIEMKTQSVTSRQSENQKKYEKIMNENKGKYVVCRSFDQFTEIIKNYIGE